MAVCLNGFRCDESAAYSGLAVLVSKNLHVCAGLCDAINGLTRRWGVAIVGWERIQIIAGTVYRPLAGIGVVELVHGGADDAGVVDITIGGVGGVRVVWFAENKGGHGIVVFAEAFNHQALVGV